MKAIYVFLAAFVMAGISQSCNDKDDAQKDQRDELVGVWQLLDITGGFSGGGYEADFTDVEFKSNGTYRINNHDEARGEGTYELTTIEEDLMLRLTPNDATKIGFEEHEKTVTFDAGKLFLSDPCCDLFTYEFGTPN